MQICGIRFDGLTFFEGYEPLPEKAGVYVILDQKANYIDVGQSENIRERLEDHDRYDCWKRNIDGEVMVAIKFEDSALMRNMTEMTIRERCKPVCGVK